MRDLDSILKEVTKLIDITTRSTPYSSWSVLMFDEDVEGLVMKGNGGRARNFDEPATLGSVSYYVATERAQGTLEPLVVGDPNSFFEEHDLERRRAGDKSPFVVAPIVDGETVLGVLNVNYKRTREISQEEVDAIMSFAIRPSEAENFPVLLIERDEELANSIESFLEARGQPVETVPDVVGALSYLKERGAGVVVASQQGADEVQQLYSGLEVLGETGFPVVLCGGEGKRGSRATEIIDVALSFARERAVRMPVLTSPAVTESGMIKLADVIEATIQRSQHPNYAGIGLESGYIAIPAAPKDGADNSIQIAMKLLAEDPENPQMRQFVSAMHAQQVVRGNFKGVDRYSPSRHLVYSIITSNDVGKIYRSRSRVHKIEQANYDFFETVNAKRIDFLIQLGVKGEDYLNLAIRRGPPQKINGHYLLTLAKVDGDLVYQKCVDGKATVEDLKKVGIRLARFQIEGTEGFHKGELDLIDVVMAEYYKPVTAGRKRPNQEQEGSLYFRNRLDDIFFGQLDKGGIRIPKELKEAVLSNYFINSMLARTHNQIAEYYVDGNPRDWIQSHGDTPNVVTKIDMENNRYYNSFQDIVSLLEFGVYEDGHTVEMTEEQKLDVLDRIILEKIRAWAVVREDVDKIKAIDSFLKDVEAKGTPYSEDMNFYSLISPKRDAEDGIQVRNDYVVLYYATSCHKNPEWAGHKTKFSTEALSIIPGLDESDPYRADLETALKAYSRERSVHVRRVIRSLDIMLDKGYVPQDLQEQAVELRGHWGRMVDAYFQ